MTNAILENIKARRSCRAYTDQMPSDEQVQTLLEAAVSAPSGMNLQQAQVIAIKNKEILCGIEASIIDTLKANNDTAALERVSKANNKIFYGAPLLIVIAAGDKILPDIDAGAYVENIALAATSMGLGNVVIANTRNAFLGEKADHWKKVLKFPESYSFKISIAVGYAADSGKQHEVDRKRITVIE